MTSVAAARQGVSGRLTTFWERDATTFLQGTTLFLVCFALLSWVMFANPAFFSTDDYYHARVSEQMIYQGRLALNFPWLPDTILNPGSYVDHHLLYHIMLAPAVYWWGMLGAKLVTIGLAAGIFLSAWLVFRQIGVKHATIWTLGLFGMGATWIFRMLMIRTNGASAFFLILAFVPLFSRRYKWLIPISFAYVWLYNGWILLPVFVVLYFIATFIAERKVEWGAIGYCALGTIMGLVINPYFPHNILFVTEHLLAKTNMNLTPLLGAEWSPFTTRTLLVSFTGMMIALVLAFIRPIFGGKRDRIEIFLMFCALTTGFMAFQSMRFFEYWPGFVMLYFAAAWGRGAAFQLSWPRNMKLFEGKLQALELGIQRVFERTAPYLQRWGGVVLLTIFVGYFGYTTMTLTHSLAVNTRDMRDFQGAGNYLKANTATGSMVFAVGFNDFSRLFFYDQKNTYLVGLDPTYLSLHSQKLWDMYWASINGRVDASSVMVQMHAQYAVSRKDHTAFNNRAIKDPHLKLVFRDQFDFVWKVDDAYYNQFPHPPLPQMPANVLTS